MESEPKLNPEYEKATYDVEFGQLKRFGIDLSEIPLSCDARDWANAFAKTLEKRPNLHLDPECMLTWFANAIMAGFNEAMRRSKVEHTYSYGCVCDKHVYPYGIDSEGSSGPPMCVWCQRLRIESLEKDLESMQREVGRRDMQAGLIQWLQSGKYRVLMQRHDRMFRAVDEAFNTSWESDTLEELLRILNDPKYQPTEKAP